jgi:hypothetical protein
MLSLTNFANNESIRTTCVSALPGLLKAVKNKQGGITPEIHNLARDYNANIYKAMKEETETECLCS